MPKGTTVRACLLFDVDVALDKYYDPHRRLRLIGVLSEFESLMERKELKGRQLIVKTIPNDKSLCSLLSSELFPAVHYSYSVSLSKEVVTRMT